MIRLMVSGYIFFSLFNIMFFIHTIRIAARRVSQDLAELDEKLNEAWENREEPFDFEHSMHIRWQYCFPFFIYSVLPVFHLLFSVAFLLDSAKFERLFYITFYGRAANHVEETLELMKKEVMKNDSDRSSETV